MTLTILPVRQKRTIHKPYIFLAILQVLDVATTGWILHHWSVRAEGNPIAAHILTGLGLGLGLALLLAFKLAVVALFWSCQTKTRIATAIYTAVVLNNLLYLILWIAS